MNMTAPPESGVDALLPAGLKDVLPPHAAFEADIVERLVAVFASFGYERVKPPLIEFEETLLQGEGAALATQTFRLMDAVSQRMLALRPDITMQVGRIAASRLKHRPRPLRLAYAGQVVRVLGSQLRPERQFGQVGAELVGASVPAADVEVIRMATGAVRAVGVPDISVDLGLPTLVAAMLGDRALPDAIARRLHTALDRKDVAEMEALSPRIGADTARLLARLIGSAGPVASARQALADAPLTGPAERLRQSLFAVIDGLAAADPDLPLTLDAVDARGFEYHTGVTFSLFSRGAAGEIGRGGRYRTGAGEEATGASLFTDALLAVLPAPAMPRRVFVPAEGAHDVAARLREQGWTTVAGLERGEAPMADAARLGCSHCLIGGEVRATGPLHSPMPGSEGG
jgi:ATP phosphoribosyltransferase regulatory subunit